MRFLRRAVAAAFVAVAAPAPAPAADADAVAVDWPGPRVALRYLPPEDREESRFSSLVRTGRGALPPDFLLTVLAPPYTGVTVSAQPTLYWFTSHAVSGPVEVELYGEDGEPGVIARLTGGLPAGVHALSLADAGVALRRDETYEWYVRVVEDPNSPSRDRLAGATVRRVAPPAELAGVADAPLPERAALLAQGGIWYDALAALSRLVERSGPDAGWRAERAALLEAVELPEAAAFDRRN